MEKQSTSQGDSETWAPGTHDKTGLYGLVLDYSHSCHPGSWAWQNCSRCFLERSWVVLNITGPLIMPIGSNFWDDFVHGERQGRILFHAIYYLSPLLGSSLIPTPSYHPILSLFHKCLRKIYFESKLRGSFKTGVGMSGYGPLNHLVWVCQGIRSE